MSTDTFAPSAIPEAAADPAKTARWIYGPWRDLLIGCGAWSAPLLLLSFYVAQSSTRGWTIAFYFLALLFNYPHFMATVYRAYHSRSDFAKYRVFTVHVALLLLLAGIVAHLWYPLLPWIFTLYIFWSPWHYTGQNFGLFMMFTRRVGLSPSAAERRAVRLSFVASYVMLLLSFNTGSSGDSLVLSLGLPATITFPLRVICAIFFFAAAGWALLSLSRRSNFRALLAPATLVATQFLWFLLPAIIEVASGRGVPQTRYSSGVLAILHSTQYLWITSYYQKREALAAGKTSWRFSTYLLTLVAGGITLFIPGPWIVSRLFHSDFAASFLTFTALVNIHHFLLDGALWKLRDKRVSTLLVENAPQENISEASPQNPVLAAASWISGSSLGARVLQISFVLLLFSWAAMDQLHFYWSSRADNISSLQRAAQLNPQDSSVQVRLAHAETSAGNSQAALAALRRAAEINSGSLALQETYARGLIESQQSEAAYQQYQNIISRWPKNSDALINSGLLALRLGHGEESIDYFQRAVDANPAEPHAQIYLAQALDQQGEKLAAARHYREYLKLVSSHAAESRATTGATTGITTDAATGATTGSTTSSANNATTNLSIGAAADSTTSTENGVESRAGLRNEAPQILAVYIRLADADAENNSPDAMKEYLAAVHFAQQSGDKSLESLALSHLAELQEKKMDSAGAAQSFQRALQLDDSLADRSSAATDWVNYAQFLRRQRQDEKLVFACLLHADSLVASSESAAKRAASVKALAQPDPPTGAQPSFQQAGERIPQPSARGNLRTGLPQSTQPRVQAGLPVNSQNAAETNGQAAVREAVAQALADSEARLGSGATEARRRPAALLDAARSLPASSFQHAN